MTDKLNELKRAYRDLEAPPHLATRIRAEVGERSARSHSWMPAGATFMAVVLVAWLAPYVDEQTVRTSATPSEPSLSAIVALKPVKPSLASVSLSRLKTVAKPKLPAKPQLKRTKPKTNLNIESDLLEEKDNVHS
ncbi:MAG TPA: hypothetical protein PKH39_15615 [Woeseiaceae bacterium]|nr:hypothetical protein [Woeseiaceae bacterium]